MSGVERPDEFLCRNTSLLEHASQGAGFQFAMIRNHASRGSATHDDMAAALARNHETQPFQRADSLRARDDRE